MVILLLFSKKPKNFVSFSCCLELSNLKNLRSLSLCNNEFVVLPEWLGSLEKLEQLRADENFLRELPNRLTTAPNLCVLSICSNRL